jgi:quercetin dioxygenase-like cupin family protein
VSRASARIRDEPAPEWVELANGIHTRRMVEGNGASIVLYRLDPGRRFAPHDHPFSELSVVLAGRGRTRIGNEERRLREGDSIYIPGGTPHDFAAEGNEPVVMLNVIVPPLPNVAGPPPSVVLGLARKAIGTEPPSGTLPV